ncbi:hypothetical protein BH11PSE11_BH11PSE11_31410 [soil metagenome]
MGGDSATPGLYFLLAHLPRHSALTPSCAAQSIRRIRDYTVWMHTRRYQLFPHFLLITALILGMMAPVLARAPESSTDAPAVSGSAPAMLLIASRNVIQPEFRQTVVLVTRHATGGAIGIVVNRPLGITLDKLFPSMPGAAAHQLHRGGPVQPEKVTYLFRGGDATPDTSTVGEQTYVGSSAALLRELLNGKRPNSGVRIVSGYAGWADGQLEGEISRGDWHVLPVDTAAIFDGATEDMWRELHRRATALSANLE